jgi:hypothetical protein
MRVAVACCVVLVFDRSEVLTGGIGIILDTCGPCAARSDHSKQGRCWPHRRVPSPSKWATGVAVCRAINHSCHSPSSSHASWAACPGASTTLVVPLGSSSRAPCLVGCAACQSFWCLDAAGFFKKWYVSAEAVFRINSVMRYPSAGKWFLFWHVSLWKVSNDLEDEVPIKLSVIADGLCKPRQQRSAVYGGATRGWAVCRSCRRTVRPCRIRAIRASWRPACSILPSGCFPLLSSLTVLTPPFSF